jgi:CheY-specific phosphatase CheX
VDQNLIEPLRESLLYVLEHMAFLVGESVPPDAFEPGTEAWLCCRMGFSGERDGTLTLMLPESLCREVAANMLGVDPDDSDTVTRAADAARELLNVCCGQVLLRVFGKTAVFQMHVPSVTPAPEAEVLQLVQTGTSGAVSVEGRFAAIALQLQGAQP